MVPTYVCTYLPSQSIDGILVPPVLTIYHYIPHPVLSIEFDIVSIDMYSILIEKKLANL